MKIYAFEDIDESLKLLPLAARRALDACRLKVSLSQWQKLPHGVRRELVQLGSAPSVNTQAVHTLLERGDVSAVPLEKPDVEPSPHDIPEHVMVALSAEQVLSGGTWVGLHPLDRYVLSKVASRGRPERWAKAYAEVVGASALSSHLGARGDVRMVDVSGKSKTARRALAESSVSMSKQAFDALAEQRAAKGDVLATARIAGIMAAKRTSDIIPLCHTLGLTHCEVSLELLPKEHRVAIQASAEVFAQTGVEMEVMLAATAAALTVYDMLKGIDRSMSVGPTRLLEKSGGKSGDFRR